ncbi:transposase [Streptomyces sp. NPDC015345]|uniref:transposase n=1 Tax=Streptomyces sp. NPDC015345 TaxID=3364953 RepID=UPI0036F912D9
MTDAEWAVVREALPVPAWQEGRGGQPEGYCHRQMLDAIRYVTDNGIKWRAMPCDSPAWGRVYAYPRRRREAGLAKDFHSAARIWVAISCIRTVLRHARFLEMPAGGGREIFETLPACCHNHQDNPVFT